VNKLYFGDNLDVLREKIKDESVNLVYLDPPFQSNANYNVLFKPGGHASQAQAEAFRDTWEWGDSARDAYDDVMKLNGDVALVLSGFRKWLGEDNAMMAYLAMMTARLIELRRVLKPDGSIYLHCDPTASHYLKLILDAIFGHESFRNEIIWKRTYAHGGANRWGDVHDVIFFYTMGDKYTWTRPLQSHTEEYLSDKYRFSDERGRYRLVVLTGPGPTKGASGAPWRGYDPTKAGRHWAVPKRAIAVLAEEGITIPSDLHEQLELLYEHGFIRFPEKRGGGQGVPEFKFHLPKGQPVQDIIVDIPPINSQAIERLHYPTQKPVALLKRIIEASSNKDDVILDPFCGCGTTIEAAQNIERQWLGIDVTHYAITLIERRLARMSVPKDQYDVVGRPTDMAGARDLARRDKHQFQWWAAWRLGARWYREEKKGADRGIDGRMLFKNGPYGDGLIIISVKGGENIGVKDVRDLRGVIEREEAEMGVVVTLEEPTGPMVTEAAAAGVVSKSAHGRLPRLQVVTIADILDGRMPKLPPLPQIERAATRAPRAADRGQLELLLPFVGEKVIPKKGDFIDPSIMAIG
jgi:site-specific DNA-methyltransferase (adenine-specific)